MGFIVSKANSHSCLINHIVILGYRAARVRVIFELPLHLRDAYPDKVAYVDWFNDFPSQPAKHLGQFQVSLAFDFAGRQLSSVIPLTDIHLSCHMGPNFGSLEADVKLMANIDIFRICRKFYFNDFGSYFVYELMRHWKERLKNKVQNAKGTCIIAFCRQY